MSVFSLSYSIDSNDLLSTMLFMMLGIFLASAYTTFIKKFRGEFVLALIETEAFDEASAKSLEELGIKKSFIRSRAINTKFFFSPDYFVLDGEDEKYYIDKENIPRLKAKYGNAEITLVQLFITVIAFLSVALVMATLVPEILNMLKI